MRQVGQRVTSVDVSATLPDGAGSTLTVNGAVYASGAAATVPLNVGDNAVTIVVTAQDGTTTRTYTLTANRAASAPTNADLRGLTVGAGTLSPAFAPGTTAYVVDAGAATASIELTAVPSDGGATMTVNGQAQAAGVPRTIPLHVGVNPVAIAVTAPDGTTTKTYQPGRVDREPGDIDARVLPGHGCLCRLHRRRHAEQPERHGHGRGAGGDADHRQPAGDEQRDPGGLPQPGRQPDPHRGHGRGRGHGVTGTIDVGATPSDAKALVTVDGRLLTGGTPQTIPLNVGANTIPVMVFAQDGTAKSYTVTVNRAWAPQGGGGGGGGGGDGTPPTPAVAAAGSVEIDPAQGGSVSLPDGCAVVTVPPGAIGDHAYQVVAETPQGEAVTMFSRALRFQFGCAGTDLTSSGANAQEVFIHYYDEKLKTWIPIPTRHDPAGGRITGEATHLTTFALLVNPRFKPFADIAGHWSEEPVLLLQVLGVASGFEDASYRPELPVTRAQFVKLLAAAAIPDWARGYVAAALRKGWVRGYQEDNTFRADRRISRAELAVLLARALGIDGAAGTSSGDAAMKGLRDAAAIPEWARAAVSRALADGLLRGYPDGSFGPDRTATRAEIASVLARAVWRLR